MENNTLALNRDYLIRENVLHWVLNYCKRNKISQNEESNFHGEYIRIKFKSERQLNCFVQRGNNKYPYFEFL